MVSGPERLEIEVGDRDVTSALLYSPDPPGVASATLVLAHGAGAGQHSPFMTRYASGLATRGLNVLTFNFLYTERRRRVPDKTDRLEACFRAAIRAGLTHPTAGRDRVFIGGKSMGGRIATHLAAAAADDAASEDIAGVVLLGYPLHPPGQPEKRRAAHLSAIRVPLLFVHGARDPFGTPEEMRATLSDLATDARLHIVENGDHSLTPSRTNRDLNDRVHGEIQDLIAAWISAVSREP